MTKSKNNGYELHPAKIIRRIDESESIFSLKLQFVDPSIQKNYTFQPGQFNMLYLYGVGEIAISILSDPLIENCFEHTIRVVGRVTKGFQKLKEGDIIGVRGPYGNSWPVDKALNKNILIITGGLGCAPVSAFINTMFKYRQNYKHISILQGVKHSDDLIYQACYRKWANNPDTEVLIAADVIKANWPWYKGTAVDLLPKLKYFTTENTIVMMCGPEIMMHFAALALVERGMAEDSIYLSMERNMQCSVGHCGHCQFGPYFICKDGPIFDYATVKPLLMQEGF